MNPLKLNRKIFGVLGWSFILTLLSCKKSDAEYKQYMNNELKSFCRERGIELSNKKIDTLFYKDSRQRALYYTITNREFTDTITMGVSIFSNDGMLIYWENGEIYHWGE